MPVSFVAFDVLALNGDLITVEPQTVGLINWIRTDLRHIDRVLVDDRSADALCSPSSLVQTAICSADISLHAANRERQPAEPHVHRSGAE